MAKIFSEFSIGDLTISNRILVSPMCQYSAHEGNANSWHLMHLGQMATSGAGLVIIEATAVIAEGRITSSDLGLYCDENEESLANVLKEVRKYTNTKFAIQLAHAGRKASSNPPWKGGRQVRTNDPGGWQTLAPSPIAHGQNEENPMPLDINGMANIKNAFVASALRAVRLGIDGIEIHMAHGYLLHEFLSPLSNHREDEYGGTLSNRMRFPIEVFKAVRAAVPVTTPVWVRVSATDWVEGGWSLDQTIALIKELQNFGCAAVDVSTGGLSREQVVKLGPGYQVPFAKKIKMETGATTIAVGLITKPEQAESIIVSGDADLVAIGRSLLFNPRWPWHAAANLGAQIDAPPQYWRSSPLNNQDIFKGAPTDSR
ncbi:NADH:flavin oxidoreductase/NADH oxidase [Pseudomonas taiwanensis]|uniref:NADH:flavin oxidoreductase/NADH oxidase n=1 Tax=Pseudomonas taiwanensis TaxID=470150 RepID=A0ABR6V3G4_9PSED|nr:NADH:flavin oxidoreductase/NADH oxidase [Pseudomonas taiwanensis]MBC3475006.1 NADH:flavin oxidoreductase/NADH oxidase [Pseudomonas taiwanensis]